MIQSIISKKIVLGMLLLSSLFYSMPTLAVPVPVTPFLIEQPDGEKFMARRWGDEFQSGYEDTDGYSIVQNQETSFWYYAATDKITGELVATEQRADKEVPERTSYLSKGGSNIVTISQKHMRVGAKIQEKIDTRRRTFEKANLQSKISATGTFNLPVVLVDFPSVRARTDTPVHLANLVRSMDTYFNEVSFGKFRVSAGPNGIMRVSVNRPKNYYATDSGSITDIRLNALFADVGTALRASNINLSRYDNDNDGSVDELVIVAAGIDSATTVSGTNSPLVHRRFHSANAQKNLYPAYNLGSKRVDNMLIISEFATTGTTLASRTQIGVFAHELLHTFGMPDLYDGSRNNDAGIGNWGIMAYGTWLNASGQPIGSRPVHPSAYVKTKLGWITPERKITHGQGTANKAVNLLLSAFSGRRPANTYKCSAQTNSKEYFLMENRSRTGFDRSLPGEGMLIWHIDESVDDNNSGRKGRRRLVTLEEADGNENLLKVGAGSRNPPSNSNLGDITDPFPRGSTTNRFDQNTKPNSKFYDFKDSGFYLKNITQNTRKQVATNYSCKSIDIVWLLPLVLLMVFRRRGFNS